MTLRVKCVIKVLSPRWGKQHCPHGLVVSCITREVRTHVDEFSCIIQILCSYKEMKSSQCLWSNRSWPEYEIQHRGEEGEIAFITQEPNYRIIRHAGSIYHIMHNICHYKLHKPLSFLKDLGPYACVRGTYRALGGRCAVVQGY